MKWDGLRAIAVCESGECRLYCRIDTESETTTAMSDISGRYPELVRDIASHAAGRRLIVDGEIVVPTAHGAPAADLLRYREDIAHPDEDLLCRLPAHYHAYDVLALEGASMVMLPYILRRRYLSELGMCSALASTPPYWLDVEAERLLEVAARQGLAGIVSKDIEAPYQPGCRSGSWVETVGADAVALAGE